MKEKLKFVATESHVAGLMQKTRDKIEPTGIKAALGMQFYQWSGTAEEYEREVLNRGSK